MMKADKNYNRRTEKDYNWFRTFYYMWFLGTVVYPVTKLMYNIKIEGRENVQTLTNRSDEKMCPRNQMLYMQATMFLILTLR